MCEVQKRESVNSFVTLASSMNRQLHLHLKGIKGTTTAQLTNTLHINASATPLKDVRLTNFAS